MSTPKVLITGANGFVGRHLIRNLSADHEVVAMVLQLPAADPIDGVTYIEQDITRPELFDVVRDHEPDFIVHLAAKTRGWFQNPGELLDVNVGGTLRLYDAIRAHRDTTGGYQTRVLYVSSSEVYVATDSPMPVTESAVLNPVNMYGVSKVAADRASYACTLTDGLDIVIARPFTHTGRGQPLGLFVPDMIAQVVQAEGSGTSAIVVGNMAAVRDYLPVGDVVDAYRRLLHSDAVPGAAYNVCSGQGIEMGDLLNLILDQAHVDLTIEVDPDRLRPTDVPVAIGDNTKLRELTGWEPSGTLAATVDDMLTATRAAAG